MTNLNWWLQYLSGATSCSCLVLSLYSYMIMCMKMEGILRLTSRNVMQPQIFSEAIRAANDSKVFVRRRYRRRIYATAYIMLYCDLLAQKLMFRVAHFVYGNCKLIYSIQRSVHLRTSRWWSLIKFFIYQIKNMYLKRQCQWIEHDIFRKLSR